MKKKQKIIHLWLNPKNNSLKKGQNLQRGQKITPN